MEHDATDVRVVDWPAVSGRKAGPSQAGRLAALGLGGFVLALFVATVFVSSAAHLASTQGSSALVVGLACLVVGVLLAMRRPGNAMGWCLLAIPLFLGFTGVGGSYSVLVYRMHRALPLGGVGVILQPMWAPAIMFLGLSFLIFPDGHFSSRTVKWLSRLVLALGALWVAGALGIAAQALATHTVHIDSSGNLLMIDKPHGAWAWWGDVQGAFFVAVAVSWIVWAVQQVPRYRRANDEQRHQLKWLLSGAGVALVCGLVAALSLGNGWVGGVATVGLSVLPVSIAIGVTKFHLYEIDRLVSRTLSYLLLSGLVIGVYVGMVTLVTKVIGLSSPVGVAASTLVAVAVFTPLRRRLQRIVDRRFYRAQYDSERTVSAFAERLRESLDAGAVTEDLMDVVHSSFEPAAAGLWVRPLIPSASESAAT